MDRLSTSLQHLCLYPRSNLEQLDLFYSAVSGYGSRTLSVCCGNVSQPTTAPPVMPASQCAQPRPWSSPQRPTARRRLDPIGRGSVDSGYLLDPWPRICDHRGRRERCRIGIRRCARILPGGCLQSMWWILRREGGVGGVEAQRRNSGPSRY